MGLNVSAISRWEQGNSIPSVLVAVQLAEAVGASIGELCYEGSYEQTDLRKLIGIVSTWEEKKVKALLKVLE